MLWTTCGHCSRGSWLWVSGEGLRRRRLGGYFRAFGHSVGRIVLLLKSG